MFSLSTCNAYSDLTPIRGISYNAQGLVNIEFSGDINAAYQLNLTINPNLGSIFDYLISNPNAGLRLTTDYGWDFAFIRATKSGQPIKQAAQGSVVLTFFSMLMKLSSSIRNIPINYTIVNGSAFGLIQQISNDFYWQLIGTDNTNFTYSTGIKDNLSLLDDICKKNAGWSFREAGIFKQGGIEKPLIQVGDLNQLPTALKARKFELDDPFDTNTLRILQACKNYNQAACSHLLIVGGNSGSDANGLITLDTSTNLSIQSGFPVVDLGMYYTNNYGITKTAYLIQNTNSSFTSPRIEIRQVSLNGNSQGANSAVLQQISSYSDAQNLIYNEGVSYLKANEQLFNYSYDLSYPRLVIPGDRCDFQYLETWQGLGDMQPRTLFNIQETQSIRNVKINLGSIRK